MKLSVVIPVFNSEKTINSLVDALFFTLEKYALEVILVNDCSKDRSEAICNDIASKRKEVKFISLKKNCGEHKAVICGLNYCTGDYVAIIDDDFQNPPSEIVTLLNKALEKDYDVVYSKYEKKQHSSIRNLFSYFNNFFATLILDKSPNLYLSSFKVLKKDILPSITSYKGPYPYIDALILRTTENIATQTVLHANRIEGRSNYTFRKLFSLYLSMLINFSTKPLRLASVFVFFISGFSFFAGFLLFYQEFIVSKIMAKQGVLVVLLFTNGISLLFIGFLCEYIGKILMTVNNSPQYTIKYHVNIHSDL